MNKYIGQLKAHSEMCCGAWPQFHDDRGLHGENNEYWNWDYIINFGKDTKIKKLIVFDKDGKEIYNDSWTYDREGTCFSPFYFPTPKEMVCDEWLMVCSKAHKAIVETDEILEADKEKA